MATPITEKNPVTTAIPGTGMLSPPAGTSKSTPAAPAAAATSVVVTIAPSVARQPVPTSPRSRRAERGDRAGVGATSTPASVLLCMLSISAAPLTRCRLPEGTPAGRGSGSGRHGRW